jgi:hypothetical protein
MKTYFQHFDNITFSEMWSTAQDFLAAYNETGLPKEPYVDDETISLVYLLLLGKFADSTIKPYNTFGAFTIRFMSKVWQYAPAWKKQLDIQSKLRELSLEDGSELFLGGSAIYNTALNPGTQPSTADTGELEFINSQNTTKYKKSKIEGFAILSDLLKNDVTDAFLNKFNEFFRTIIYSGRDLEYITEDQD